MNRRCSSYALSVGIFVIVGATAFAHIGTDDYDMSWYTFASGGTSSGGPFELSSTFGQPNVGTIAGADFTFDGGFGPGGVAAPCPLPGDVNCDGIVNLADLLMVIANWGSLCDAQEACPGDATHDDVVNLPDLLAVIANWGAGG